MRKSLATAAVLALAAAPAGAATVYTDQGDFLAHLGAHVFDDFNDLTYGEVVTATASRGPVHNQVTYSTAIDDVLYSSNGSMSVSFARSPLVLTFESPDVYAVGGTFFTSDYDGNPQSGDFTVTLADSTSIHFTGGPAFAGFVSSTPITSLTLSHTETYNGQYTWISLDDLYYGAAVRTEGNGQPSAVPTPAAAAGALPLLAALAYRRSRRQAR